MNIIFISSLLPPLFTGGAEILTLLVAEGLVKKGHKVTIFTGGKEIKRTVKGIAIREIKELNWSLRLRSFLMPLYSYWLKKRLLKEKEFLSADVVHATDFDSISALAGWKLIEDKLVVMIQDYGLVCPSGDLLYGKKICPNYCHLGKGFLCLKKRKLSWFKKTYLEAAFFARKRLRDKKIVFIKKAVCVSGFIASKILKINPKVQIALIGNCLPEEWQKLPALAKKDIDVLYVGVLKKYKGIDILIKALKILREKKQRQKLKVVVVGKGDEQDRYRMLVNNYGLNSIVTFIGEVKFRKMKNFYRRAKIVVVPSLWPEPCGRVIIEGMSFGAAVVATNCGGTPETIIDKKYGFLIPPGNQKALADTINNLLSNDKIRKKISQQAKRYVWQNFKTQKVAKKYEGFYNKPVIVNKKKENNR